MADMPISTAGFASLFATIALFLDGFAHSADAQGASYKIVAFTGQSAPGGGTYHKFLLPRIGANGTIGFIEFTGGEGSQASIYAGAPGSLDLIVQTSDSQRSPNGFADFFDLSVSKDGYVAFTATSNADEFAVWSDGPSGNLGSDSSGISVDPSELGTAAFRSGSVAIKAVIPTDSGSESVLLVGNVNSLNDVLQEGQLLGGQRLQTIYDTSDGHPSAGSNVDMNESGSIAIKMVVTPSATPAPKEAIYAGSASAPTLVARQGDAAPGLSGSQYEYLSASPSIAANGLIAFTSSLATEGSGPGSAVFSGAPNALAPLVQQGAVVPTTDAVTFETLSDAVVNSTGDVVFRAQIRYPNESSREGIWVKRRTGPPVLLAISGMSLLTPSGSQEVSSVDFAGPGTFNDLHEFVFRAQFENGDQGIYVADTRPGAPVVHIATPTKPRNYVTTNSTITVAGSASDDTGVAKVEYTVAREVSASGRKEHKRGKKMIISRTKLAKGGSSWNFKVPLSMGLNLISIVATDKLGNASEAYKVRVLRYECSSK